MTTGPFSDLHHVCLVVDDIEESVKYFESLGITGWQNYPPLSDYTEVSLSREDFETLTYKFVNLGEVQLQLCEPGPGDTSQRHFLETRGPGVYHLGFSASDVDDSETTATEAGLGIRSRGRRADGTGFTYFETEGDLGVTLEVRSVTR